MTEEERKAHEADPSRTTMHAGGVFETHSGNLARRTV